MICPHCHHTIREEQRYLMSRTPDGPMVPGAKWMICALLFVILLGVFSLHASL